MGFVADVYFDDERWSVRYLVVDTGHVMPECRVLIAPEAVVRDQPIARSDLSAVADARCFLWRGVIRAGRGGRPHK
jgi:hypothetical protein